MDIIMSKRIAIFFLLTLFVAACSRKSTTGVPYILYEVHGTVVDPDGTPIKDIVVYSGESEEDKTSVNGEFVIFGKSSPSTHALITCEDKDKELNGGEFTTTNTSVELRLRSAGNGNNKGNYFASEVVIKMIPKDDSLQDDINPPLPL